MNDGDYYAAPGDSFEFGLEAIFDGLERQLQVSERQASVRNDRVTGWFA